MEVNDIKCQTLAHYVNKIQTNSCLLSHSLIPDEQEVLLTKMCYEKPTRHKLESIDCKALFKGIHKSAFANLKDM